VSADEESNWAEEGGGTNIYDYHYKRVHCNSAANNPHGNLVASLAGYAPVEGEDAGFDQE